MAAPAVGSGMAASGMFGATAIAAGHSAVVVGGTPHVTVKFKVYIRIMRGSADFQISDYET